VQTHENLLGGPPPTLLPDDAVARDALAAGTDPAVVAAGHPALSLPWAVLAEQALAAAGPAAGGAGSATAGGPGHAVQAYAYARVGYHRGLDALRGSGWRGHGPVPWSHRPNQGFLRALAALGRAAGAIGESAEHERCLTFLAACDPAAAAALGL